METYLITGATGYIGSMLVRYLKEKDNNINVIALVRNKERAISILPKEIRIIQADLADRTAMLKLAMSGEIKCDYVIHCASVTKSAEMVSRPVEVIESIVNTTQNMMELAKDSNAKSVVYLSSMEVYGNIDCSDGHRVVETELGEVDILNARSCYPLGKRMAENICYSYYREYDVPVKIARLAQVFGRGVLPNDNRVFTQFARAVREGTDIVLHTEGTSMGNYCALDDALAGIEAILKKGTSGEAYNVVNEENTMTIRQMAELVVKQIADDKIKIVFDIPTDNCYGYAASTGLRLSSQKLEGLGWKAQDDLVGMYRAILQNV